MIGDGMTVSVYDISVCLTLEANGADDHASGGVVILKLAFSSSVFVHEMLANVFCV
jgi:hypothetical protein